MGILVNGHRGKKLVDFSYNIFSQFGEDGITLEILRNIGDSNRFCVEFGAYPNECNSKVLKVDWGWNGIAFDFLKIAISANVKFVLL
jgi:hypothetical protein